MLSCGSDWKKHSSVNPSRFETNHSLQTRSRWNTTLYLVRTLLEASICQKKGQWRSSIRFWIIFYLPQPPHLCWVGFACIHRSFFQSKSLFVFFWSFAALFQIFNQCVCHHSGSLSLVQCGRGYLWCCTTGEKLYNVFDWWIPKLCNPAYYETNTSFFFPVFRYRIYSFFIKVSLGYFQHYHPR